ncbi:MAG: DUF1501 domain-containing protein [Bacteroidetes bacterium]|nr:DUF1501 domain-containing protein [Bacteroidota bacterium]
MKRRTFIQQLAATGMILPVTLGFPRLRAFAQAPPGSEFMKLAEVNSDVITVIIRLAGGNDGLNTVVPYTNAEYYKLRTDGSLFIKDTEALKLKGNSTMGLHPSLAGLQTLYDEEKVSIIQNVGYPNQNFSHFRSTDIWLSGTDADVFDNSGWYAKFLEELYPDYPDVLPSDPFAIELGTFLSSTLIGKKNNMGIAIGNLNYVPEQPDDQGVPKTHVGTEEAYVREVIKQTNIFTTRIIEAGSKQTKNMVTYPTNNPLSSGLSGIARIIAGGLKTQMYIVNVGGYDTHSNQLTQQATLHKQFAEAVLAFQRDLEAFGLDKRVCMMTISEFGRRAISNGSGTDHGSAAPLFVIGSGVNGGFIGSNPNLNALQGPGNIPMEHDFRQVYASLLGQWYGAGEQQYVPSALPRSFQQLPIFKKLSTSVSEEATQNVSLGMHYPSPADEMTTIPIGGILSGTEGMLGIYTPEGRLIAEYRLLPGLESVEIDTKSLPSGMYLYTLSYGDKELTQTLIVQH